MADFVASRATGSATHSFELREHLVVDEHGEPRPLLDASGDCLDLGPAHAVIHDRGLQGKGGADSRRASRHSPRSTHARAPSWCPCRSASGLSFSVTRPPRRPCSSLPTTRGAGPRPLPPPTAGRARTRTRPRRAFPTRAGRTRGPATRRQTDSRPRASGSRRTAHAARPAGLPCAGRSAGGGAPRERSRSAAAGGPRAGSSARR